MKKIIVSKLSEIEEKENVRIIHAVESGSRGWGFASPDSDYDVRFIYVRPKEFYLKLNETRDVIEWQLDETFDISGWDLRKTLRLLHNSNPRLFEWNASPIVYKTTNEWIEIKAKMKNFFSIKTGLYHYFNTADRKNRILQKEETKKLKTYFYIVRPLLACKWILNKKSPPPVLFSNLMDAELEAEMKPLVEDLIRLKMNTPEKGEVDSLDKLNIYIEENLVSLKNIIDGLPEENRTG